MTHDPVSSPAPASPRVQKLLDRFVTSAERVQAFFDDLDETAWAAQVYTEGAHWTVQEVLTHFVVAEDSLARLVAAVVDGSPGVPEAFDLDAFNEREVQKLSGMPPDALLRRFWICRRETMAMVSRLSDADLNRRGRHPWLGVASVEEMLKLMYRHNQIHQRDIRAALGG